MNQITSWPEAAVWITITVCAFGSLLLLFWLAMRQTR